MWAIITTTCTETSISSSTQDWAADFSALLHDLKLHLKDSFPEFPPCHWEAPTQPKTKFRTREKKVLLPCSLRPLKYVFRWWVTVLSNFTSCLEVCFPQFPPSGNVNSSLESPALGRAILPIRVSATGIWQFLVTVLLYSMFVGTLFIAIFWTVWIKYPHGKPHAGR